MSFANKPRTSSEIAREILDLDLRPGQHNPAVSRRVRDVLHDAIFTLSGSLTEAFPRHPLADGLMHELGEDISSIELLVKSIADQPPGDLTEDAQGIETTPSAKEHSVNEAKMDILLKGRTIAAFNTGLHYLQALADKRKIHGKLQAQLILHPLQRIPEALENYLMGRIAKAGDRSGTPTPFEQGSAAAAGRGNAEQMEAHLESAQHAALHESAQLAGELGLVKTKLAGLFQELDAALTREKRASPPL